MGYYSKALSFLEKGLDIRQQIQISNHPNLADSYNNLGVNKSICICDQDYYRVECFTYDRTNDQCQACLSYGICLKGNIHNDKDFFYVYVKNVILFFFFLHFVRSKLRKTGVENSLLIISIINQCSLLFLLLKIIHIILESNGNLFHYNTFNLFSSRSHVKTTGGRQTFKEVFKKQF
ncbi:unnamed protein product [Rotaria sp. Silwood1]|nr:unnamed protein product [Rotaria sp. Silwood1]